MSAQQGGSSSEELSSERARAAVLARAPGKKSAAAVGAALARARCVPEADRCADLSDFLWHCERPEVLAAQHGTEAEHAADWSLDRRLGLALQLADVDWYRATLRVSKEFTSRAAEDLAFAPMGWFPGWPWDLSAYSAVDAALISICIGRLLFELARAACAGGPTEEEDLEAIRCTCERRGFPLQALQPRGQAPAADAACVANAACVPGGPAACREAARNLLPPPAPPPPADAMLPNCCAQPGS